MSIRYRMNLRDLEEGQTIEVMMPDNGAIFFTRKSEKEVLVVHTDEHGQVDNEMSVPIVKDYWRIEYNYKPKSNKNSKKGTRND